jgi:phospholipase/lecithinase/hemolysin
MRKITPFVCLVVISLIWPKIALGQTHNLDRFQRLVVFGDSLSDNGNSSAQNRTPAAPYFEGRWTNGLNWLDYFPGVANHFGPITAFLKDCGTNFATGSDTSAALSTQIETFLANFEASGNDLYVIWIGANDFAAGISSDATVQNIYNGIVQLLGAGARDIMILNIPDISLTPAVIARGGPTVNAAKHFVYTANNLLTVQVRLAASIYLVHANVIDINSLFAELVTEPTDFGFKNSAQAAFNPNTGKVVPDPNDFLFWDGFHPTTNAHFIAAEFIYRAIISNLQLFEGTGRAPLAKIGFWWAAGSY